MTLSDVSPTLTLLISPPPPPPPPYFIKSAVRGEGNTPAQEIIPQLFNIYKIIGEYNSRAGTFGNGSLI